MSVAKDNEVVKSKQAPKKRRFSSLGKFFKGTYAELKKVHWPSRHEVAVYSAVVIATVAVIAIILGVFDFILGNLVELIIN